MNIDLSSLPLPIQLRLAAALTDEELMRFSRENQPFRIERNNQGEITVMTPVGGIVSTHKAFVSSALYLWSESTGGGVAFGSNAGFNLPDGSCLSPDAAWLAMERWNALTGEEQAGFPPLCPEFVIEIRSRSDSRRLLEAKMQLWLENGAQLAWLVDPIEGEALIYRTGRTVELLKGPETLQGTEPVDGFELRCSRLWPGSAVR